MIILTGSDGFIGKHFKNSLESGQQLILPVDVDNAFNFLEQFNSCLLYTSDAADE